MKNSTTAKVSIYFGLGAIAVAATVFLLLGYDDTGRPAQSNISAIKDGTVGTSTSNEAAAQTAPVLTGNLTVYIIATPNDIDAREAIPNMKNVMPFYDTMMKSGYGASPKGQVTYQLTEINSDKDPDGFAKGEKVMREAFVKGPETVKFYIDPELKKDDGSPITRSDFREDYRFGNGIICCGVELTDGTAVGAAVLVADQTYDSQVMEAVPDIKTALDNTSRFTLEDFYENPR